MNEIPGFSYFQIVMCKGSLLQTLILTMQGQLFTIFVIKQIKHHTCTYEHHNTVRYIKFYIFINPQIRYQSIINKYKALLQFRYNLNIEKIMLHA